MSGGEAIPPTAAKNLSDKLYDKRKQGAADIESMVKTMKQNKDESSILALIEALKTNFVFSSQANSRKGGLIGLASTAVALLQDVSPFLPNIIPPILKCFSDQDSKVRFHACEAMYNVAKLCADPDVQVKSGTEILDRLVKDIVTESDKFNVERFIPLIKDRIVTINPYIRQFLINWISTLNSVPEINLVMYLPEFLDGLFKMLSDPNPEIRQLADAALADFLKEVKESSSSYLPIVRTALAFSDSGDDFTRLTSITWLHEFVEEGGEGLLSLIADILGAVLPCLSHKEENIRHVAARTNQAVKSLIMTTQSEVNIEALIGVLTVELVKHSVPTRIATLQWILMLLSKAPEKIELYIDELFPLLLKTLSDPADGVVSLDLQVLSRLSSNSEIFKRFMGNLIELFSTDHKLLSKAGFIIRTLSMLLKAEDIYRTLAKFLETHSEEDIEFASVMVQTLNIIMLTSHELSSVREMIRQSKSFSQGRELFHDLYRSWCHNPVSTISLCLLAQEYGHASMLVKKLGDFEITVTLLVQIDKLVQLLESPVYSFLRLQLLEPTKFPDLLKTLFGLLMLLPQSSAYDTLKNRLKSVSTFVLLDSKIQPTISFPDEQGVQQSLVDHFTTIQEKHEKQRMANLKLQTSI